MLCPMMKSWGRLDMATLWPLVVIVLTATSDVVVSLTLKRRIGGVLVTHGTLNSDVAPDFRNLTRSDSLLDLLDTLSQKTLDNPGGATTRLSSQVDQIDITDVQPSKDGYHLDSVPDDDMSTRQIVTDHYGRLDQMKFFVQNAEFLDNYQPVDNDEIMDNKLLDNKLVYNKLVDNKQLMIHNDEINLNGLRTTNQIITTAGSVANDWVNTSEMAVKRLPKAIIIGVKKSGTRALLEFLRIHPDVECTGPEPHYFDKNFHLGIDWYRNKMPGTLSHQMTIEKTPGYFVTKEVPHRIFAMDPNMKLILVVRDPVSRSISDYCQAATKHSLRPYEQMALLDESLGLINTSWSAIKIGVYSKHLEQWLQVFPRAQIHVVDGQRLIDAPASEVAQVERFLGLPRFINESHFHLRGFKGKFPCLIKKDKLHCLGEKTKGREHPVVSQSVLQRLRDFYRPFNAKFFQLVGQNFAWN